MGEADCTTEAGLIGNRSRSPQPIQETHWHDRVLGCYKTRPSALGGAGARYNGIDLERAGGVYGDGNRDCHLSF